MSGGTAVAISGTGFNPGATVTIGGSSATSVVVGGATSITAVAPAHAAGSVDVVVTNTDTQFGTLASGYTYVPAPTVTAISPTSGTTGGGTAVTITGTALISGATVTIGGTTATSVVWVSSTSITAVTPAHAAGLVDVVVTNPTTDVATGTGLFTYVAPSGGGGGGTPEPTPPPAPPAPPVATHDAPVTELIDSTVESTVDASIEVTGGTPLVVSVTVPAGATASTGVTMSIQPVATPAEAGTGVVAIQVTAHDSTGAPIRHFDIPLTISLGRVASSGTAAYSEDGLEWTVIQQIDGPPLPAGLQEGYYVSADGSTIILTRHLTYFGMKQIQPLMAVGTSALSMSVGDHATATAFGGFDSLPTSFKSITPTTCSVTSLGVVTGLEAGICKVVATRAGNGTYLNVTSAPISIVVLANLAPPAAPPGMVVKTVMVTGTTLYKLVQISFGARYANKKVIIQVRKPGTTKYVALRTVTLNKAGVVRTALAIAKKSVVRIVQNGKVLASTTVK
jgi:hypothetical protein